MPTTRVRDVELYWERHGQGPTLLFIGGSGGDLRQKPSVFDGPLPRSFDVISFDQRGLGRSSRPERPYTMEDYGEDAAALLEALGVDRCRVMGVSFGGMVAQELAIRHPERVEALVLACTSSGGEGGASYPLHRLEELPEEERAWRSIEISDTRCDARWREAEPEAAARALAFLRDRAGQGPGDEGFRRQLQARAGHDTWARLPRLSMPVLIAAGRYDGIAPLANQEAMACRIPHARLEIFEGGHLFLMQDERAFPCIEAFLRAPGV